MARNRLNVYQQYALDVVNGRIVAGHYVKRACQRFLDDLKSGEARGLRFDAAEADRAIEFFGFLKHSKGEWAGDPFLLEPWQKFVIGNVFGWLKDDGTRRFRVVYEEIPRKNGKSTKLAGIGLKLLVADDEPGAEIYSAATKRDQARIIHSEAIRMRNTSPGLKTRVRKYRDNLNVEATNSKYEPLGADADTMDGLNIHGALIDELHAHKTRAVLDVLDTGTSSRRQPLIYQITTAGFDRESVCYEQHEYATKILDGTIEDDEWFCFIAAMDEGDDWQDPVTWAKANPNLGVSVKGSDLARKAKKAAQTPAALNAFLRLHLNVWTQQHSRWVPLERWDECRSTFSEGELAGRKCYGGLDLASVSDLVAWVLVFPEPDDHERLKIVCRAWCPESRLTLRSNRYASQYQAWEREGWLDVTPGDAIDYGFVKAQVLNDAGSFGLVDFNVDRLFQGHQLMYELAEEGLKPIAMGQGFLSMASPMKEFERRLLAGKLEHDGNPLLRWAVDNVVVKVDPAGNLKPDKATSQGKIDPFVALVMAVDRATRHEEPVPEVRIRRL